MTTIIMLRTVGFDDQLHFLTDKVCNEGAKWLLLPEFIITQLPIAQAAPEQTLLQGQLAAELFRAFQSLGSISGHRFAVPPPLTKIF